MAVKTQNPIARIALRGTVWVAAGSYAYQLIGFVALIYLRRLLAPEMFGFFDLATFWVAMLGVRNKIGLTYAALRHGNVNGVWLGTVLGIDFSAGLIGLGVMLLAMQPLVARFGYGAEFVFAMTLLAIAEFITVGSLVFGVALEKELQLSRNTLGTLIAYSVGYAVAIGLAIAGYRLTSLLSISIVTALIGILIIVVICRRRLPHVFAERWRFDPDLARAMLKDGLTTGLTLTLLYTVVSQFDNFLNATYVSAAMQGYYGNAFRIASWPNVLLAMIIVRVGYNVMTRVKDDKPRLTHTVRLSLWLICMVGVPMALAIGLGASDLIEVLFPGGKWATSALFLPPLAASCLANTFIGVGYWLSVALGRRRFTTALAVAQAACLMIGGFILVQRFSVTGTVIAVILASICGFVMSQAFVIHNTDLRLRDVFIAPVIASLATFGIHQGIFSLGNTSLMNNAGSLLRLAAGSAFIFVIYWISMVLIRRHESMSNMRYLLRTWRGTQPT